MTAKVFKARLEPSGREFSLQSDATVLDSALHQRVLLRYGCRNGRCSSCKYLLIDGEVDFGRASPYCLSEHEKDEGWALLCQARPLSDLVMRDQEISGRDDGAVIVPKDRTAKVAASEPFSGALWRIDLALSDPIVFHAGQYVEVEIPERKDQWRCYSIASPPEQAGHIELVVKRIPGGGFSDRIDRLLPGLELAVRGPYGLNYLRNGNRPVLLVAAGSGIAPLMSILRSCATKRVDRVFHLYYGARTRRELIFADELKRLGAQLPHFTYKPTLSAPLTDDEWLGERGRVTQLVQREVIDAHPYDAYVCGRPEMCEAVSTLLLAKGIPENRIFRDDFFPAG